MVRGENLYSLTRSSADSIPRQQPINISELNIVEIFKQQFMYLF